MIAIKPNTVVCAADDIPIAAICGRRRDRRIGHTRTAICVDGTVKGIDIIILRLSGRGQNCERGGKREDG